jgi:hypothetical protein
MGIELSFSRTLGYEILVGITGLCEGREDLDGEM